MARFETIGAGDPTSSAVFLKRRDSDVPRRRGAPIENERVSTHPIRQRYGREAIKLLLGRLLRWSPLTGPEDGFSIILGVPWDLRQLLSVNLRFVAATDVSSLRALHVVFDRRRRPEMEAIEAAARRDFPGLPLVFHNYSGLAGWLIEKVHVSTFYNSMNTTLALAHCRTRYAVLHDFDLYPLRPDHFTSIVDAMKSKAWRFSGHELTHFDGLKDEDCQIGTWTLGVDAEWLRASYRPIDCFHRVARHENRWFNLDPFAWVQFQTTQRGLVSAFSPEKYCHVQNLCSTYLRFLKRAPLKVAWRMHYLWYLEELSGRAGRMDQLVGAMNAATSAILELDGLPADFRSVHITCANVLEKEINAMERALFGRVRGEAVSYIAAFRTFLTKFGEGGPIVSEDGKVVWSPQMEPAAVSGG